MVQHAEGVIVHDKPSFQRDMARIDVLRQNFNKMYSIAPGRSLQTDSLCHINSKIVPRAADATSRVLKGNKLDYILLEYVHMTKLYYMCHLLVGPAASTIETTAASNLKGYLLSLHRRGLLKPSCKMQLARVESAGDY